MGSRGVYRNGRGRSRRSTLSPIDDDEQQDEREDDKEREPVVRIPTLRSTIVRMNVEDNDKEEIAEKRRREKVASDERGERQQRQAHGPPGPSHGVGKEDKTEIESEEDFSRVPYRESNARGSETATAGGRARNYYPQHRSERRNTTPDRVGGGGEGGGGGGWGHASRDHRDSNNEGGGHLRDSDRGGPREIDRDRARMLQERSPRSPLRSPQRERRGRGDYGGGFRRESSPLPRRGRNRDEDSHIGNAAAKLGGGDQGGKRKRGSSESPPLSGSRRGGTSSQTHHQRDRGLRERGSGGDHRSLNHAHDGSSYHPTTTSTERAAHSRRGRGDSPGSVDSRERETVTEDRTYNNRAGGQQQQGRFDSDPRRRDVRRERGERGERGGSENDIRGRGDRKREAIDRAGDVERERERGGDLPYLYSVQKGTVHSVRPFGIFVRMNGYRNHGLVHLSQISDHEVTNRSDSDAAKVEAISSIVGEGEQVWVKVISIKTEDDGSVKVGCSLKYVSQGDGRDLDPNNLQLEKLQSKSNAWQAPKKMELDAVYNVVCTRCGGHGHMKKDCYSTGEKTYALLKDEDAAEEEGNGEPDRGGRREGRGRGGVGSTSSRVAAEVAKDSIVGGLSMKPPSRPKGRGRAMVQPAWMKHGVGPWLSVGARGSNGQQEKVGAPPALESLSEEVTTLEEAIAVLRKAKKDKGRRKDEGRQHSRRSNSSRREKKHGGKEGRRGKHKKRRRGGDRGPADYEDSDHWHQKSRKRQRT